MTAYYSEYDPFAAAWLQKLIAAGLIAPGVVDTRDLWDVTPNDLRGFTQVHLCAGIGIWSYAGRRAGWRDDESYWSISCPCQPFSAAGKGDGFADERHLWPAAHWLIEQCRPELIVGEQVRNGPWIDLARADTEGMGYTFGSVLSAACWFGAPFIGDRSYWVASTERHEQPRQEPRGGTIGRMGRFEQSVPWDRPWPTALAEFRVLDDGHPRRVGATDAFRNALCAPQAEAWMRAIR